MYTPSLYGCLVSHLLSKPIEELKNTRVCLFSYGSGLASSMFSLVVTENENKRFTLENLLDTLKKQKLKLNENRVEVEPEQYDNYLKQREITNKKVPRESMFDPRALYPGTWYLKSIDECYRRVYDRVVVGEFEKGKARDILIEQFDKL